MLLNKFISKINPSNNLPIDIKQSGYSKGLLAGHCTKTGKEVFLDYDRLVQHVAISGSTGSGTSLLHKSLLKQHISNCGGLLFISGGLSDDELTTIYDHVCLSGRKSDFILIDTTDSENISINLEECILENKIVFVKFSIINDDENAVSLVKSIISDCRSAIARLQRLPVEKLPSPPFLFIPNNCSSYIDESWSRMFEQGRSSRFAILPSFQTLKSLQPNSDELLSEIVLGNTYYKFFFKQASKEEAENTSNIIGMICGLNGNETYITEPEKIGSIPVGECLLLVGNDDLYHLRLPNHNSSSN